MHGSTATNRTFLLESSDPASEELKNFFAQTFACRIGNIVKTIDVELSQGLPNFDHVQILHVKHHDTFLCVFQMQQASSQRNQGALVAQCGRLLGAA